MGLPFARQNYPCAYGIYTPSNTRFLGLTPFSIPNGMSIGSAVFAQLTAESPYTKLQWIAPFPLKIAPLHRGFGHPSNTWFWFPEPTQVHNPNGISITSPVLQGSRL